MKFKASWLPLIFESAKKRSVRFFILSKFVRHLLPSDRRLFRKLMRNRKSQLGQEVFALFFNDFNRRGYFVEFGATNGIDLSNTFLLEKEYGWNGLLAEPARIWQETLKNSRDCNIDFRCVWSQSGKRLMFCESLDANFSSVQNMNRQVQPWCDDNVVMNYEVTTISLNDLLQEYKSPQFLEYLSIDVEGSELEVLKNFNLNYYQPLFVTVEHGYGSSETTIEIDSIFTGAGYAKIDPRISLWDSWFVNAKIVTLPKGQILLEAGAKKRFKERE